MTATDPATAAVEPMTGEGYDAFLLDCQLGLRRPQKAVPCKWLYDDAGSKLFERICDTPEYYPSRTEVALLEQAVPTLEDHLAPDTILVEFGSGASRKTRLLLDVVDRITRYVPIDVSAAELDRATAAIGRDYPWLELFPILGDFTSIRDLGQDLTCGERLGFFPGSTLGNFAPDEATGFLRSARDLLGSGSRLLLGVDLAKDVDTLLAAYDDRAGATAAFNLNLLARMNRELAAGIDLDAFQHRVSWNETHARIEMHLLCLRDQAIRLAGERFAIAAGETIHTENSHKFSLPGLTAMIVASGWTVERRWIGEAPSYALMLLRRRERQDGHVAPGDTTATGWPSIDRAGIACGPWRHLVEQEDRPRA